MSGILGKKLGMTRLFQDDGRVIPITVVQCDPNEITQIKTTEKDGYPAIVLGFSKLKKPTKTRKFRHVREFKIKDAETGNFKKGDQYTLDNFTEIKEVTISAIAKGKGFQGVVKRFHFSRGPETHGSHHHREPGSIGTRAKPGRVHKGKKLPGRETRTKITLKKIKIISIDPKKNILCLKGSVPGPNGGLITISA